MFIIPISQVRYNYDVGYWETSLNWDFLLKEIHNNHHRVLLTVNNNVHCI